MVSVGKRQTSVTPSQAAVLADGYKAGATIGELAEQARLHRQTVIRHLVRAGVELLQRGLSDEEARTAAKLYADGLTLSEVGERLGVSEGRCGPACAARALRDDRQGHRRSAGWAIRS